MSRDPALGDQRFHPDLQTDPRPRSAAPDEVAFRSDAPEATDEASDKNKRPFWREVPILVVVAVVVALLIKTFLLQAFFIPSASMEPTLDVGDRVLVEKIAYRFGEPQHGDVIVFERDLSSTLAPETADQDAPFWQDVVDAVRSLFGFPTGTEQDFIKRVVAVGGDRIEARGGRVLVNGDEIQEPYLPAGTETQPFGPSRVPAGTVFVMGDNRGNSDDSRSIGPISVKRIVGRAFLLVWPASQVSTL